MRRFKVSLPDGLAERAAQKANEEGLAVATWIRRLVIQAFEAPRASEPVHQGDPRDEPAAEPTVAEGSGKSEQAARPHRHHYDKPASALTWDKGQPYATFACDCGETSNRKVKPSELDSFPMPTI